MKAPRFVLCISNHDYEVSLVRRKIYQLVDDQRAETHGQLRVIDESGDDYLFPAELFISLELPAEVRERLLTPA